MYLDHPQNWLVYGHGLLICLILALFWLIETGQIRGFRAFRGERMEEMAWNGMKFCTLMYLDHLQNWLVYGHSLLVFSNFAAISTQWNGSNLGFSGICWKTHWANGLKFCLENAWREWPEILHADVSWPPSEFVSSGLRSVDFCDFGTILT